MARWILNSPNSPEQITRELRKALKQARFPDNSLVIHARKPQSLNENGFSMVVCPPWVRNCVPHQCQGKIVPEPSGSVIDLELTCAPSYPLLIGAISLVLCAIPLLFLWPIDRSLGLGFLALCLPVFLVGSYVAVRRSRAWCQMALTVFLLMRSDDPA